MKYIYFHKACFVIPTYTLCLKTSHHGLPDFQLIEACNCLPIKQVYDNFIVWLKVQLEMMISFLSPGRVMYDDA